MAQNTSGLWKELIAINGTVKEYKFEIDGIEYGLDAEIGHSVNSALYSTFGMGNAFNAELRLEILAQSIPKGARIKRFVRLRYLDRVSEWLQKGEFFVSKRSADEEKWTIEAFDAMMKAEKTYVPTGTWPKPMNTAVNEIASSIGVSIDSRTAINPGYMLQHPVSDVTERQVLCEIAAAHGGNWIITDTGLLRLVPILPQTTIHEIGMSVLDFSDDGKQKPISRVSLFIDNETYITAGNDDGLEISAYCPSATQDMVSNLLLNLTLYEHQKFSAMGANLDPAAELGDQVSVYGITATLSEVADGKSFPDIASSGEAESEEEYPYESPMSKEFNRKIAVGKVLVEKTAESLRSEITGVDKKVSEVKQTVDGFTLTVTNGSTTAKIELKSGKTVIASGTIEMDGLVNFTGLANGTTTIHGGCITTGKIQDKTSANYWDLDDGKLVLRDTDIDGTGGSVRFTNCPINTVASKTFYAADYMGSEFNELNNIMIKVAEQGYTPTSEEMEKFDFNMDGVLYEDVDILRYMIRNNMNVTVEWKVKIDPNNKDAMIRAWRVYNGPDPLTGDATSIGTDVFKIGASGTSLRGGDTPVFIGSRVFTTTMEGELHIPLGELGLTSRPSVVIAEPQSFQGFVNYMWDDSSEYLRLIVIQRETTAGATLVPIPKGALIRLGLVIYGSAMSGIEGARLQSKEATPSTETQTVMPDAGYSYLSQVVVNPIPYEESDNSAGGTTVTIG